MGMRRGAWLVGLGLGLAGCAMPMEEHVHHYNEDGVHLFSRGDYDRARESFQPALKLKPEDIGLMYNVGQCDDRMGNATQAEQTYYECLVQAPNHAPSRQSLAFLVVLQCRTTEAT